MTQILNSKVRASIEVEKIGDTDMYALYITDRGKPLSTVHICKEEAEILMSEQGLLVTYTKQPNQ